jgi:hypothetical protein
MTEGLGGISRRRWPVIFSAVALLCALLPSALEASPARRAEQVRSIDAKWSIKRMLQGKEVTFKVRMIAWDFDDSDKFEIDVTRRKRVPDTVIDLTEKHSYDVYLNPGSVVVSPDLKTGSIDTESQLGSWGKVQLDFAKTGPTVDGSCPGTTKRPGKVTEPSGKVFNFKTGNTVLGNIVELPEEATARIGSCEPLLSRGDPCPKESKSIESGGTRDGDEIYLQSGKHAGASKASVEMSRTHNVEKEQEITWSVVGKIPANSIHVDDVDLDPASLSFSDKVPFLSGSVSIKDPGEVTPIGPFTCSGHEYTTFLRNGDIAGSAKMKVSGVPTVSLDSSLDNDGLTAQKVDVEPTR